MRLRKLENKAIERHLQKERDEVTFGLNLSYKKEIGLNRWIGLGMNGLDRTR